MSILALPSAAVGCIAREPQILHGVTIHNSNALRPVVISDQVDTEIANHLPDSGSVGVTWIYPRSLGRTHSSRPSFHLLNSWPRLPSCVHQSPAGVDMEARQSRQSWTAC